jgi:hypothetical protein
MEQFNGVYPKSINFSDTVSFLSFAEEALKIQPCVYDETSLMKNYQKSLDK